MKMNSLNTKTTAYTEYCDKLITACKDGPIELIVAGHARGNDIYQITVNPDEETTVCLSTGIHGNEKAGPHAILKFLQMGNFPDLRLLIYPMSNPYGYINNTRFTINNFDLNRGFNGGPEAVENEILKTALSNQKINYFYSLHEDDGSDGVYLYYSDLENEKLYRKLLSVAENYFPITKKDIIYDDKCENGLIPHDNINKKAKNIRTLEYDMYTKGMHYLCFETPGALEFQKRVNCQLAVLRSVLNNHKYFL